MRAFLILAAAIMFGLAGGYGWAAWSRPKPHLHVPKARDATPPPLPVTAADKQWSERADDSAANAAAAAQPQVEAPADETRSNS